MLLEVRKEERGWWLLEGRKGKSGWWLLEGRKEKSGWWLLEGRKTDRRKEGKKRLVATRRKEDC